jgi:hypothetical protein
MDWLGFMTVIYLVGLYTAWVVLPLIPAVLTFWLFPNTTVTASGPLANLTVNATGAFAAYLIVFLVSIPLVNHVKTTIDGHQRQYWTIRIPIKLVDDEGKDPKSNVLINKLKVRPATYAVEAYDPSKKVYWGTIKIVEEDGQLPFALILEIPDFGSGFVNRPSLLSAKQIIHSRKEIELDQPVEIFQVSSGGAGLIKITPEQPRPR